MTFPRIFTHFFMLYVGSYCCKLPVYNLMLIYHCRIILEEPSMSMKNLSQYRLRSGKDSNLALSNTSQIRYRINTLLTLALYIIP
jgi:hypothetical protein